VPIKQKYKNDLEKWLTETKASHATDRDPTGSYLYNEWEYAQVQRLIDYLDVIKTPHAATADTPKLYNDFKTFYHQYDIRRGKNFHKTFPKEFTDFFDSIPGELLTEDAILNADVNKVKQQQQIIASDRGAEYHEQDLNAKNGSGYVSDEVKGKK